MLNATMYMLLFCITDNWLRRFWITRNTQNANSHTQCRESWIAVLTAVHTSVESCMYTFSTLPLQSQAELFETYIQRPWEGHSNPAPSSTHFTCLWDCFIWLNENVRHCLLSFNTGKNWELQILAVHDRHDNMYYSHKSFLTLRTLKC